MKQKIVENLVQPYPFFLMMGVGISDPYFREANNFFLSKLESTLMLP